MRKTAKRRVRHLSITEAKATLGDIAKRARGNGDYFLVEKNGAPVLGIMDAEEMEDYLELRDPQVRREIQKSNDEYVAGKSRPLAEFLSELAGGKKKVRQRPRP